MGLDQSGRGLIISPTFANFRLYEAIYQNKDLMQNIPMDEKMTFTNDARIHVLVVDDHPSTAVTLERAISQLGPGIDVVSATSGKQALEYAELGSIDILITDMMMPGMNGLELIERLQSHPGGHPIHTILITAYDIPGLKESARRLKVNETLLKPVHPERIFEIVGNILNGMGQIKTQVQPTEIREPFKILIADDVSDNLTLLSRYLKNEGYNYITASNGIEALQKIRLEMPDLILLDVNMPEKDGFAVLEELRSDVEIQHLPVIILTAARPNSDDIQSGLNLGADDYVVKPFDRRELFARIRTKLRVKESEDAIRRRNRELSVLPEIGKELSARLDIDELLSIALRRTVETLGAILGHITILNGEKPLQKTYHASPASFNDEVQFPQLAGFLKKIGETRHGLIIDDVQDDSRWQVMPEDPTRSVMIMPMFGRNNLLGLLVLAHEQSYYFKPDHLILLQAIASQAGIALENAQLFASLAQEQRRLASVLQNAADAILMFDADGALSLVNPAGQKLFTDFETKLGQSLLRGAGYDLFVELLDEARSSNGPKSGEILWPDQRTFSVLITPIHEGGFVVMLHDVSHFKKLEQVKNEFIATASHDLKNPITSITGFLNFLAKVGPLNDQQIEFVHQIEMAVANMKDLVQNMLELAKVDLEMELKLEDVAVYPLLEKLEDEFLPQASAKQQILRLTKTKARFVVQGDPLQLHQALSNLIGNAIKYTPAEGTITISVKQKPDLVSINVQDTGCGIPASDLPFIFDRFYRVRHGDRAGIEGNGLGLAIVKSIAGRHGGKVTVESESGKGSCFSFSLPLA